MPDLAQCNSGLTGNTREVCEPFSNTSIFGELAFRMRRTACMFEKLSVRIGQSREQYPRGLIDDGSGLIGLARFPNVRMTGFPNIWIC